MRTRLLAAVAFLTLLCVGGLRAQAPAQELSGIPHFTKVTSMVWAGGQPTPDQLTALVREGVKVVINLRVPSEGNDEGLREAEALKARGVAYFNIPVVYNQPKTEDADAFLTITDAQIKNGPVFIHCAAGIRAGAFWMIRRVLRDGWTPATALDEAHRIGLGNQQFMIDFANQYIAAHPKQ